MVKKQPQGRQWSVTVGVFVLFCFWFVGFSCGLGFVFFLFVWGCFLGGTLFLLSFVVFICFCFVLLCFCAFGFGTLLGFFCGVALSYKIARSNLESGPNSQQILYFGSAEPVSLLLAGLFVLH